MIVSAVLCCWKIEAAFAMNSIALMNTPLAMILSEAIAAKIDFKCLLGKRRLFWGVFLRQILSAYCRFINMENRRFTVSKRGCEAAAILSVYFAHGGHVVGASKEGLNA